MAKSVDNDISIILHLLQMNLVSDLLLKIVYINLVKKIIQM